MPSVVSDSEPPVLIVKVNGAAALEVETERCGDSRRN